jgi:hypothetical protein
MNIFYSDIYVSGKKFIQKYFEKTIFSKKDIFEILIAKFINIAEKMQVLCMNRWKKMTI